MKTWICILALTVASCVLAPYAQAGQLFIANLNAAQEVPPHGTAATGFGTVFLNDAMDTITVDLQWTGLTLPAIAAHIHNAPAGLNGPIIFPLAIPNTTSGIITGQFFAISAAQVAELQAGNMYMNIHDAEFPGGEIRGQLAAATPEPATFALIGAGLIGLALVRRKRR